MNMYKIYRVIFMTYDRREEMAKDVARKVGAWLDPLREDERLTGAERLHLSMVFSVMLFIVMAVMMIFDFICG